MSRRRALPCWCAGALLAGAVLACAAAPDAAPPPAPTAQQVSPERQRFEHWKQDQPAADPRPDFERQAEAEAERRRREALEAGQQLRPEAKPEASGD